MATGKEAKQLFGVRIYPDSAPPAIVAVLATSPDEAEEKGRQKSGLVEAPAIVREAGDDEMVVATFDLADDRAVPRSLS